MNMIKPKPKARAKPKPKAMAPKPKLKARANRVSKRGGGGRVDNILRQEPRSNRVVHDPSMTNESGNSQSLSQSLSQSQSLSKSKSKSQSLSQSLGQSFSRMFVKKGKVHPLLDNKSVGGIFGSSKVYPVEFPRRRTLSPPRRQTRRRTPPRQFTIIGQLLRSKG